jgi:hypothetical protein
MHYAYKPIIVSMLLHCNYWLEINETLLELSIPRGDAHIVNKATGQTLLTHSYGP